MGLYRYKVRDKYGKAIAGTLEAQSEEGAALHLKTLGYVPILIEEEKVLFKAPLARLRLLRRLRREDINLFTRQLATLQKAGVPLLSGLASIREGARSRLLQDIIGCLIQDIEGGISLSEALKKHPGDFAEIYINMIKVGETVGLLDESLEHLANLGEYEAQTHNKIKLAMRYPSLVILAICIAFPTLIVTVIPKFVDLFGRFNAKLPLPTRILLGANSFIINWWRVLVPILFGAGYLLYRYIHTSRGRLVWDGLKLKVPVFGDLSLKVAMARFAHLLGIMTKSGMPILQSLELVGRGVGNVIVGQAIEDVRVGANEGKGLASPMRVNRLFPTMLIEMVHIGEGTGKLDELLLRASEYYDSQVDYTVKNLTTLIEPFVLLILGGMVLVMALGIFLPMWDMIHVFQMRP